MKEHFAALRDELTAAYSVREEELCGWRRHLHAHPEVTGHEKETAAFVSARLREAGIPHRTGIGGHGVVAVIEGGAPGPTVAIRGDMDGLEIAEETGLPYASQNPGVMHACGHDFHTAGVLAAGVLLNKVRARLPGSVVLLFQPAEEAGVIPGGAHLMIADGALESPHVDAVFGAHLSPAYPAGTVCLTEGAAMAAVDNFVVTVAGSGGHAGYPHRTADPLPAAAQIILGLSALAARTVAPGDAAVLSLGKITGGTRVNIIPDRVLLEGTMRTLLPATRHSLKERVLRLCRSHCEAYGCRADIQWLRGYDATVNPADITALARGAFTDMLGVSRVLAPPEANMGGEDFGAFLLERPGVFYFVGCGGAVPMEMHSARYAPPERVLGDLVRCHIALALRCFEEHAARGG